MRGEFSAADIQAATDVAYGEARGQGKTAMQAVVETIVNRAVAAGASIKEAAYAAAQYSALNKNDSNRKAIAKAGPGVPSYDNAMAATVDVLSGKVAPITNGATFYHADNVNPKWSKDFEKTVKIGGHTFYGGDVATQQAAHNTRIAAQRSLIERPADQIQTFEQVAQVLNGSSRALNQFAQSIEQNPVNAKTQAPVSFDQVKGVDLSSKSGFPVDNSAAIAALGEVIGQRSGPSIVDIGMAVGNAPGVDNAKGMPVGPDLGDRTLGGYAKSKSVNVQSLNPSFVNDLMGGVSALSFAPTVTSGFRQDQYNNHSTGKAADFRTNDLTDAQIAEAVRAFSKGGATGIGAIAPDAAAPLPAHLHVDQTSKYGKNDFLSPEQAAMIGTPNVSVWDGRYAGPETKEALRGHELGIFTNETPFGKPSTDTMGRPSIQGPAPVTGPSGPQSRPSITGPSATPVTSGPIGRAVIGSPSVVSGPTSRARVTGAGSPVSISTVAEPVRASPRGFVGSPEAQPSIRSPDFNPSLGDGYQSLRDANFSGAVNNVTIGRNPAGYTPSGNVGMREYAGIGDIAEPVRASPLGFVGSPEAQPSNRPAPIGFTASASAARNPGSNASYSGPVASPVSVSASASAARNPGSNASYSGRVEAPMSNSAFSDRYGDAQQAPAGPTIADMFSAGATNFSAGFPGEKPAAVPIGVVPTSRPSPVTSAVPVSGPSQSLDFTNGLGEIPTPGAKPQVDSKTGKVIGSVLGGILGSALGGPLLALPLGYVGGQIGKKGMPNFGGLGKIGMPSLGKFASEAGFRETATGRAVTEAQRTGDWSNYYGNIERFGGDNISSGAVARAEAERARAERESGSNISEPKGGYDKSTSGWF